MHKFRTNSQPWLVTNVQNSPEIPFVINFTNGTLSNSSLEDKPINYTQSKLYYESDTIKTNLRCMNNLNKSSTDIWPSSAKKNFGNTKNILLNLKIQCEKYKMFQIQTKFLVADFDFTSKKIKHNYHFTLDKLAELRKKFSNFSLTINPFIRANETDTKFIFLSPVLTLNESTKTIPKVLFIDHEFFELQIYQKDKLPYTKVYTEVYYNWQTSKMVESMERKRFEINNKIQHFPYNVLVLGIDSLSSQHMERLLPKSFDYATKKMKFDYFRNSQVSGGNTYPNLMALLSGVMELNITTYTSKGTIIEEHDDQYLRINSSFYDTLPFTWKLLPKYYTTVMIEDYYWIAMFNYLKKGFSFSPTDVYMRPYFTQSEKYATDICDRCALFYELVNDYLEYIEREFQLNSENDMLLPFYFLSFHKKCSHDRSLVVGAIDKKLLKILKRINKPIYLENTLMLIYGDHGTRMDAYIFSQEGTIEKGKSCVLLRLPDKFSEDRSIFRKNTDRFVTPFDLHRTILHLLQNEYSKGYSDFFSFHENLYTEMMHQVNPQWANKTRTRIINENRLRPLRLRGIDLFVETVPWNRSCTEATSTNLYCSCNYFSTEKRIRHINESNELKTEDRKLLNYVKKDFFGSIFPSYATYRNICQHLQITKFKTLMINRINNTDKNVKEDFYLNQMIEINTRVGVNNDSGEFQLSYIVEEWSFTHPNFINHILTQIFNLRRGLLSLSNINTSEPSNSNKYLYWRDNSKLFTLRRSTQFIRLDKYSDTNHCLNQTTKYIEKVCICFQ